MRLCPIYDTICENFDHAPATEETGAMGREM
jgi:hypothetical protein